MAISHREAEDGVELPDDLPNFERGCGSLDHDSTYLTADVGPGGDIPAFVSFDRPIPYREGHFRTFKRINGTEFLLDATQYTDEYPENESTAHRERVRDDRPPVTELPESEVLDYIGKAVLESDEDLPEYGGSPFLRSMSTMDLLMHVGKSYYPTPESYIREARMQGVSKKIPASGNQEPPRVRPGRTRLFIIHPRAIPTGLDASGDELTFDGEDELVQRYVVDGDHDFPVDTAGEEDDFDVASWDSQVFIPGIIGYGYLTRVAHTEKVDGSHPEWVEELSKARDDFDSVGIGDFVPGDDADHPAHGMDDGEVPESDAESDTDEDSVSDAESDASPEPEEDPHVGPDERTDAAGGPSVDVDLSGVPYNDLRSVASTMDIGSIVGMNPSGERLRRALEAVPVEATEDGFVAHVDGASYEVHDDWADAVPKIARAHAKMSAKDALDADAEGDA
jgi:hypothetical protein